MSCSGLRVVVGLRAVMLLPCRAQSVAAMRYVVRRGESSYSDSASKGCSALLLLPAGGAGDSPFGWKMTGRTIEMRPRIGLPAIFAAFFRLGAASFGGGTEGWLYREIVERRRWIDQTQFLS